MPKRTLDDIDRKILVELQADGRMSLNDLAAKVGLSPSPCLRRVRMLERDGVISRYVAVLDQRAVGLPVSVFVSIKLDKQRQESLDRFAKAIERWPEVLERLKATLESTGVTVTATPWSDHVEDASGLKAYDLILPVIAWGYHRDHGRWLKACATWREAGLAVANPAEVLRWNSDKAYLARLADRGVPIPPTRWTDRVTQDQVDAAFAETGASGMQQMGQVMKGVQEQVAGRADGGRIAPLVKARLQG